MAAGKNLARLDHHPSFAPWEEKKNEKHSS
jgi:hypothetical protein